MKKRLYTIAILLAASLIVPLAASAWDDCPFGYSNDPFPGRCALYEDTNNDKICDHSQSAPQALDSASTNQSTDKINEANDMSNLTNSYHAVALAIAAAVFFLIGKVMVSSGELEAASEKKFWNTLLLVFFVGSALTGIVLSLRRDFGWFTPLPHDFLWLHAETSLFMAFITIYHVLWHWKYYVCIVKGLGSKKDKSEKSESCDSAS